MPWCYPIWHHNGRITSVERGSLTCFEEEKLCVDSRANVSSSPVARTDRQGDRGALRQRRRGHRADRREVRLPKPPPADRRRDRSDDLSIAADVSVKADDLAAVRFALEKLGGVDVLVNNAGIYKRSRSRRSAKPTGTRRSTSI